MHGHRPDIDKRWTLIQERIQMESMVIKDLDPDTSYQFAVRAMNSHGPSPRSLPSDTVQTTREYLALERSTAMCYRRLPPVLFPALWTSQASNRVSGCVQRSVPDLFSYPLWVVGGQFSFLIA